MKVYVVVNLTTGKIHQGLDSRYAIYQDEAKAEGFKQRSHKQGIFKVEARTIAGLEVS
jgi:hypothetical protein